MTDPLEELDDAIRDENRRIAREMHESDQGEAEVEQFVSETLLPTLNEIGESMKKKGLGADVSPVPTGARIVLTRGDKQDFSFEAKASRNRPPDLLDIEYQQRSHASPHYNTVPMSMTGTRRALSDISRDDIIQEFKRRYEER